MSDVFPGSCHIVISEGNTLLKDQPTLPKDKYKQNYINLVNVMPEEARKAVHVYILFNSYLGYVKYLLVCF